MTARDFIENELIRLLEQPALCETAHEAMLISLHDQSLLDFIEASRPIWDKPAVAENATVQTPLPTLPEELKLENEWNDLSMNDLAKAINQLISCVAAVYEEINRGRV